MNFQEYMSTFEEILSNANPVEPYDDAEYLNYAKLNLARSKRWLKTGKLSAETIEAVKSVEKVQTWIIITEPWCGDAAHLVPFIHLMSKENPLITAVYEFRDQKPDRIDDYLTNGSKSIPKLIIKDEEGKDLSVWGPRPMKCQEHFMQSVEDKTDMEKVKETLQVWYNQDKGTEIQKELSKIIRNI